MAGLSGTVRQVLQPEPQAPNDDRILFVQFYRQRGLNLTKEQEEIILNSEIPASITRTRARLQNSYSMFKSIAEAQKFQRGKVR